MSEPTDDERRIATYLARDPADPESWPWEIIRRLTSLEAEKGSDTLHDEIRRMMLAPFRRAG